jgi:6-phosphogluconate dehydrogenase
MFTVQLSFKLVAMHLGMIGLGRMGANMAARLSKGGHRVVAYDLQLEALRRAVADGAEAVPSVTALAKQLAPPRVVWIMVPAGDAVDKTLETLWPVLERSDIIVDGGNSNYKNTMRRAALAAEHGLGFVDVGTSGGIWGLDNGYCLMIGGSPDYVRQLRPIFETLAPSADRGWAHVGPTGAGHFVKMVHNGIEYGLMQAYSEGFALMHSKKEFGLNLHQIAELWGQGSVVRSWLLELTAGALAENPQLEGILPHVSDSGEGRWMVAEAIEQNVPAPVTTVSLLERLRSRDLESFGYKLLAVMRKKFGGHDVKSG